MMSHQPSSTRGFASRIEQEGQLPAIVSPEMLDGLVEPIRFVDASFYLDDRKPKEEFLKERLPGAVFFDINEIADKESKFPRMLPSEKTFAEEVTRLGIKNDDRVVVYGGANCFSAPRGWWMFKCFGHERVHVLNGGITQWKLENRKLESGPNKPSHVDMNELYNADLDDRLVKSWQEVMEALKSPKYQVVDARSQARFDSEHMPNALNVPFAKLVSGSDYSKFLSEGEIHRAFLEGGVDLSGEKVTITSCGSGVTACVLSICLNTLGLPLYCEPVYDGSWSEWGKLDDVPIERNES